MMKRFYLTTIFVAGLLGFAASAQDKPAAGKKSTAAAMPSMPKPSAEMKELRQMIGTWTSDEKFDQSPFMPAGGTGTGTNSVRLGPGGFTVLMEQRSKGAMGAFAGHGVLTWDTNEKAYKFVWADSMGPGVVIETGHKDGENLVFTGETVMMGKKISTKDVWSDRSPTSYTLTSFMNDGSGEKQMMTIKFTKQESAAPKK
jgi:hypothetical protein